MFLERPLAQAQQARFEIARSKVLRVRMMGSICDGTVRAGHVSLLGFRAAGNYEKIIVVCWGT